MEKKMKERGTRLLREYLNSKNDCLTAATRNKLFAVIENLYLEWLEIDAFREENIKFLSQRRTKEEKDKFFYDFMHGALPIIRKESRRIYESGA